ncbi:hypothetical protein KKF38_04225, partial [Patescibacteria group bacterium]|nr:hypothetical protein [Patescibacteria group bacterium]
MHNIQIFDKITLQSLDKNQLYAIGTGHYKSKNYKRNDILMNNMAQKSKYQIYQIAKFVILSVLLI